MAFSMRNSRKLIALLLILGAALFAGLEYLNRVLLPAKARQWAEQAASEALRRPVTIGRLRVHLWHGFLLEDVTVLEDPAYGPGPLLEAEQISGGILFLPILQDGELIIPTLRIVRPRLKLTQAPDGSWNLEKLFPKRRPKPAGRRKFGLLIPRVLVTGGEVEITPRDGPLAAGLRLSELRAEVGLFLPAKVEWSVSADARSGRSGEAAPAHLSLDGSYTPDKGALQSTVHAEIPLAAVPPHLPEKARAAVSALGGTLAADVELSGRPKGPFSLKAWLETQGLSWEMPQPFSSGWTEEEPPERLRGQGEIRARVEGTVPALPSADPWKEMRGVVTLDRLSLSPLPHVGEIQQISGDVAVDAQGIRAERLTALLPSGLPLEISGSVLNDAAGTAGFRATSAFPLEQFPPLPAPWEGIRQALKPSGRVSVEATGGGTLRPALSLSASATATLDDIGLELPDGRALRRFSGKLRWEPELLTVTGMQGELLERPLKLEGSFVNSAQPEINAHLSWGALSAEAEMTLFSDKLEIHALTGRLGQGPFSVLGEIGRPEPVANLLTETTLHLEELPSLWPGEPPAWIKQNPAKGELSARVLVEGDLRRPADLLVDVKASSPAMSVRDLAVRQLSVDLRQEGGQVTLNAAKAEIAQGTLACSGTLTASDPAKPWKGRLAIQDVELADLAQQLHWKTSEMSGQLQANWEGSGRLGDLSSLSGPGAIQVRGAQILEVPLLGEFAQFLALPSLKKIAFQEAQGPFTLEHGKIQTEKFTLSAPQATLTVIGSGGFLQGPDSPISWHVLPMLSPELLPEETRSTIGKVLAEGASYLIGEVRVEGTWKSPRTRFIPKPITKIIGEQISNLQELLKELF